MRAVKLVKKLTNTGNTMLGVGFYSAVFDTNASTGIAVKIGSCITDPWLDFYNKVITTNVGNPHIPVIHKHYVNYDEEYYVTHMEKLYEYGKNRHTSEVFRAVSSFLYGDITEQQLKEKVTGYTCVPNPDELVAAAKTIYKEKPDYANLDFHSGNYMLRSGIFVITDPWAEVDMPETSFEDELRWRDKNTKIWKCSSRRPCRSARVSG